MRDGGKDDDTDYDSECSLTACQQPTHAVIGKNDREVCEEHYRSWQDAEWDFQYDEVGGVRGRQEIQEEIKRLKNGIGSVSHLQSVVKSAKVLALQWVLGEVDYL